MPSPGNAVPVSYAWYGSLGWDSESDTYDTSSMSNPAYQLACSE